MLIKVIHNPDFSHNKFAIGIFPLGNFQKRKNLMGPIILLALEESDWFLGCYSQLNGFRQLNIIFGLSNDYKLDCTKWKTFLYSIQFIAILSIRLPRFYNLGQVCKPGLSQVERRPPFYIPWPASCSITSLK